MRPRLGQLHRTAANDQDVVTFSTALGYWIPQAPTPVVVCRATFVAAGGETTLFLGVTPIASSEQVFIDGALKVWGGVDYTLSGSTITFASPLSASARVVVSYFTASSCGIASLTVAPHGFHRPVPLSRPVRRFHRIR